jgi:hypothetical protein
VIFSPEVSEKVALAVTTNCFAAEKKATLPFSVT